MLLENIFSIYTLVETLWILLPAYAANGLIPIFKGKHPVDGGRDFIDGRPLLGEGKTWEGLLFGSLIGIIISVIMMVALPHLPFGISPIPLEIASMGLMLGFLLGFGAVIGDMVKSFFKRRLNIKRGDPLPILDQDDFVIGALFFASYAVAVKVEWLILGLIMTPVLHYIANFIGHKLGVKREPW